MHKNRLKIQFFQDELDYQMELQEKIEQISHNLKQALKQNSPANQSSLLREANSKIKLQLKAISNQIMEIKRQSDLIHDAAKIEGQMILKSVQQKVDDLNQRLYNAENCLQYAESIKKVQDAANNQYEMSNVKHFKKEHEAHIIKKHLQSKFRVVKEFERSIELTLKLYARNKARQIDTKSQLEQLLQSRNKKTNYFELRRNQIDIKTNKMSKSNGKIIAAQPLNLKKQHKSSLLFIILQSSTIPFKHLRSKAGLSIISKLRLQNRQQSLANKLLSASVEMRNRSDVLKYLESKSELSEEEAIMKLELMGTKMNDRFEERMIEIKPYRKCKQENFNSINKKQKNKLMRLVKSLDKVKLQSSKNEIGQNKNIHKKMIFSQKPFNSNPKTNDSLSGGRHVI